MTPRQPVEVQVQRPGAKSSPDTVSGENEKSTHVLSAPSHLELGLFVWPLFWQWRRLVRTPLIEQLRVKLPRSHDRSHEAFL